MRIADRGALLGGGALLVVGFVALLRLDLVEGTLRAGIVPTTIAWFLVAFAGFALVRRGPSSSTSRPGRPSWSCASASTASRWQSNSPRPARDR